MARGGHNRRRFPPSVAARYSPLNREPLNARGTDDRRPVLWRLQCGCFVYKARHTVANSIRRCAPHAPSCFNCTYHTSGRGASEAAQRAFRMLIDLARRLGEACTVVWEARVVEGCGPFDFWLWEWGVVVEVDGMQHTDTPHHGTEAQAQWLVDRWKEAAAVRKRLHVARLHVMDMVCWEAVVARALCAARNGIPPCVHYSDYYLRPVITQS
eukprot:XP_001698378.1 hypothetical protein CHLREDRAFT_206216 [Chlamydomonas reinhardtii]